VDADFWEDLRRRLHKRAQRILPIPAWLQKTINVYQLVCTILFLILFGVMFAGIWFGEMGKALDEFSIHSFWRHVFLILALLLGALFWALVIAQGSLRRGPSRTISST